MLKYQHQLVENLIRDSGGRGSNPSLFHYYNLSQLFKAYKTCKAYGSSSSTHELRSILTLYRLDESFANIHVHKLKKISIFSSKMTYHKIIFLIEVAILIILWKNMQKIYHFMVVYLQKISHKYCSCKLEMFKL